MSRRLGAAARAVEADVSMDEMARRLDAAADDVAEMRADLARHEPVFDRHGPGARQVAHVLQSAWADQLELAGRLAGDLAGLSASVRLAAGNYRAADLEAGS